MVDQVSRSAATLATLIAVPVALLVGVGTFLLLGDSFERAAVPPASPTGTAPAPAATGPVSMPARELTERQEVVCRALLSQLPGQLDELVQRPVTEGPEQNAAYGDPPVTVACGVPAAAYEPTDFVTQIERVCWHAVEGAQPSVWTTLDREVPVQVTVPAAYEGPSQRVVELSVAIAETVRSADTTATGCDR